ncbi:unnamed protein product [Ambrosiozyma monospora]|uniref:Unnamed protein product n=1 Tax=Ambrosiozyma monospora TaxID=43982 RepID=A0A9W6YML4_AMBMO|nr:unnamed protein product [Ambrosiozyma monospora]
MLLSLPRQSAPIVVENESDGDDEDEDEEMEDAPSDNASRGRTQAAANVASNHANQVETTPSTVANAQLPAAVAQTVSAQENVFKLMNFYMANQKLEEPTPENFKRWFHGNGDHDW